MKPSSVFLLTLAVAAFAGGSPDVRGQALGSLYEPAPHLSASPRHEPRKGLDAVRRWNEIANDASATDHIAVREQLGPGRSSRAMAIVHIAIFDALSAVTGEYESYTGIRAPSGPISMEAAISQAARDALAALFPAQVASFDGWLAEDLADVKNQKAKANGIKVGKQVASAILARRANDGSAKPEPVMGLEHITSDLPGRWRQDPISLVPIALGAYWSECKMFVLESASQFRVPPPPALDSAEYTAAYQEVKRVGGDSMATPTQRTPEQTQIGIYWGYDGTPGLGAPPRLYNQIAAQIAEQMGSDATETARLLALVNVAMADAGVTIWESKYHYDVWRPITGIREADPGTGPTGAGDGNPATIGDPTWRPLGAPASNLTGPDFTPPFPAYPSGHAGFGAVLFQTLRRFYGTDDIAFTFVSDELNGITRDNDGSLRPLVPRTFVTLSQAEEENGQSRIYLGIHWRFDKTASIVLGRNVADYVFDHAFRPRHRRGR